LALFEKYVRFRSTPIHAGPVLREIVPRKGSLTIVLTGVTSKRDSTPPCRLIQTAAVGFSMGKSASGPERGSSAELARFMDTKGMWISGSKPGKA